MRAVLAIVCLAALEGCGYVGDPQPPALHIPLPIADLTGYQLGDKLRLEFTLPQLTTEGLPLERPEVELRVGAPPRDGFDIETWAPGARRVPITLPPEGGRVRVETPAREWIGTEVFAAVAVRGKTGRRSSWSNILVLEVGPPIETPRLRAESAPEGVRLLWEAVGPDVSYNVFRQAAVAKSPERLALAVQPPYTDTTAEFGKSYQYWVQAVRRRGQQNALSELSAPVAITPADRFAPAVPSGLTALAGVNRIELSWNPNEEPDLRGYYLYRAQGDGPLERVTELLMAPAYADDRIRPGVTYRYAVSAVDRNGNESRPSAEVSIALPSQSP